MKNVSVALEYQWLLLFCPVPLSRPLVSTLVPGILHSNLSPRLTLVERKSILAGHRRGYGGEEDEASP